MGLTSEYEKIYRPLKAIRLKCLDCSNGSFNEVRLCPCIECTLHPYRMGKRPKKYTQGCIGSDSDDEDEEIIAEDDGIENYAPTKGGFR